MSDDDLPRERSSASLQSAGLLDAPVIAALQNDIFPDEPWSQDAVSKLIGGPGAIAWIAAGRDYGEVMPVGFAIGRIAADEAEVLTIGVLAEARDKGLGRRLIEAVADKAKASGAVRLHLEVSEANAAARHLYRALDFREVGRRHGYYVAGKGVPADALLLARDL